MAFSFCPPEYSWFWTPGAGWGIDWCVDSRGFLYRKRPEPLDECRPPICTLTPTESPATALGASYGPLSGLFFCCHPAPLSASSVLVDAGSPSAGPLQQDREPPAGEATVQESGFLA